MKEIYTFFRKGLNILFFLSFAVSVANANSIYVSADGNDSNSGTQESPYYTITKAVSSVNP